MQVPSVQIFGVKNSSETRAAERFFRERRVAIHYVDLKQKPMAAGEINRFIAKFGLQAILDREGKAFVDAGLQYLRMPDPDLLRRIEVEPRLLKLPLIRGGKLLSIGEDTATWKAMAEKPTS